MLPFYRQYKSELQFCKDNPLLLGKCLQEKAEGYRHKEQLLGSSLFLDILV
ncbi:hypothetical protein PAECIP111802_00389 [Paenibacillus allorhizosphaerae]|uniref:Uncharacterized protein n=1 Tax=Paenibacillus allorhizosphaerae TaxID=2849866 RepID=A0ABM8VBE5_9BACL|nr:hypothetical protein PAECIP111802_00389 [Paenibacillus allorhizosphaerae]